MGRMLLHPYATIPALTPYSSTTPCVPTTTITITTTTRYAKFLLLRKHHLELQHPIPPLDIALMWASHMSTSGMYAADCQQLLQRMFLDLPGVCSCVEGGGGGLAFGRQCAKMFVNCNVWLSDRFC